MYLVCYLYPTGEMEVGGGAIVYLAVGYSLYRGLSATCILSPISCFCVPN